MVADRDLEADGFTEHALERCNVAVSRPEFELGVAARAQPCQVIVGAWIEIDTRERLCVAAVEALSEPDHRRQRLDGAAFAAAELAEGTMRFLRWSLAVVAGDQRDDLDLLGIESAQVTVLDQVVGVSMVALVADVDPDVVEERAVFKPVAFAIGEAVDAARLVEDRQRDLGNLLRVLRPVAAALAELDHASPAHVGIPFDLADPRAVAMDVVEDEPLAQRQVAESELLGAELLDDRVE